VNQKKLRVAIAGCHRMLDQINRAHNWANAFARVQETDVVAVFDKDAYTRNKFQQVWVSKWPNLLIYDNYNKMLEDTNPDIVCISTRQTLHEEQIITATNYGIKGIACEKPFATSLKEADRIISTCKEKGVSLAFLLDRRWMESHKEVCRLIKEGIIGEVQTVVGYGSPNLINHGCHWYDMAFALSGDIEPIWVSGDIDELYDQNMKDLDPPGRVSIKLNNGSFIHILPSGFGVQFSVIGSEGYLVTLNDFQRIDYWKNNDLNNPVTLDFKNVVGDWEAGPLAISDLVKSIRFGGKTACDFEETRRATEIGFAAYASNQENSGIITLPTRNREIQVNSLPWGNE
tara:strand:+ start:4109 stop:5140 length:1032 start_codon:yes stop_codon:yes gene_type:complete